MSSGVRGLGGRAVAGHDKQELLLRVAEDVFCRLGYTRTTIGELATAAGVTRPTVYAYFPSKDDVFGALASRVRDEFLALQETVDGDSPEAARRALAGFLAVCTRHHGLLTVIDHQALGDPAIRELRDEIFDRAERRHTRFLGRLADAGRADPAVDPAQLSRAITGVVVRFADLAAREPRDLGRLCEELDQIYLRLVGFTAACGERSGMDDAGLEPATSALSRRK